MAAQFAEEIKGFRKFSPAHPLRPQPDDLVPPENAPGPPQGRSLGLCRAYPGAHALPDNAPLHFRERREQVQEELRHGAVGSRVD